MDAISCSRSRSHAFRLLALAVLLLFPAATQAQFDDPHPKWEVNGGFSYQSLSAPGLPSRDDSLGGWGGFAWHSTRRLGLAVEFATQKNPECARNDIECIVDQLTRPQFITYSSFQLLGGPRIRTDRGGAVDFFGHGMVGLARTKVRVIDLTTGERSEFKSGARLALGFGGGMDWNVAPAFAIRVFQLDYIPVRHNPEWRHNIRVQVGLAVRFGGDEE